jgi:hypothetical protein
MVSSSSWAWTVGAIAQIASTRPKTFAIDIVVDSSEKVLTNGILVAMGNPPSMLTVRTSISVGNL